MKNSDLLKIIGLEVGYKSNGEIHSVISDLSLQCKINEIIAIVGISGSGKTTLLKAIGGLIKPIQGKILLGNKKVEKPSNERGLVFQEYCVFPWLTVKQNVILGAKCSNKAFNKKETSQIDKLLESIGLSKHQNKWPHQLSGGMQQRVALARSIAADPILLLLDEPFGALDAITRLQMQQLIKSIFNSINQSIILVTHDVREAVSLADRIALLSGFPSTISKTWKISNPRKATTPYMLSKEHERIVEDIYNLLELDNKNNLI